MKIISPQLLQSMFEPQGSKAGVQHSPEPSSAQKKANHVSEEMIASIIASSSTYSISCNLIVKERWNNLWETAMATLSTEPQND